MAVVRPHFALTSRKKKKKIGVIKGTFLKLQNVFNIDQYVFELVIKPDRHCSNHFLTHILTQVLL